MKQIMYALIAVLLIAVANADDSYNWVRDDKISLNDGAGVCPDDSIFLFESGQMRCQDKNDLNLTYLEVYYINDTVTNSDYGNFTRVNVTDMLEANEVRVDGNLTVENISARSVVKNINNPEMWIADKNTLDITATSADSSTYRGEYDVWNYESNNAGSFFNMLFKWKEWDFDFIDLASIIDILDVTGLKMDVSIPDGSIVTGLRLIDVDVNKLSDTVSNPPFDFSGIGTGTTGNGFFRITADNNGTAANVVAIRTIGRISNVASSKTAISYQGYVEQRGTGDALALNPFFSNSVTAHRWYALQPTTSGGVIPLSDRFAVHTNAFGHIMADRGSLIATSTAYADLSNPPTPYIKDWNSTNGLGYVFAENDIVSNGTIRNVEGFALNGSQGINDTGSYWLCTASDCSTTCQVAISGGIITGCT